MAFWRIYVDLPPILGPVISSIRRCSLSRVLLAINGFQHLFHHQVAAPLTSNTCSSQNVGRHSRRLSARSARLASTSICSPPPQYPAAAQFFVQAFQQVLVQGFLDGSGPGLAGQGPVFGIPSAPA